MVITNTFRCRPPAKNLHISAISYCINIESDKIPSQAKVITIYDQRKGFTEKSCCTARKLLKFK